MYSIGQLISNNANVQHIEEEKGKIKVFLLGRSYVGVLNPVYISTYLWSNGINAEVIRPANMGISQNLKILDDLIANKPDIVVYGISFHDIGYFGTDCPITDKKIPPFIKSPLNQTQNDEESLLLTNLNFTKINPKHVLIELLRHYFENQTTTYIASSVSKAKPIPLDSYVQDEIHDIQVLNSFPPPTQGMCYEVRDRELNNLRIIINKLKENNVKVFLYIPPYTEAYLETMPDFLENHLTHIINETATEFNFPFYDLSHKYKTFNIFLDHSHVARNPQASIYNIDISKFIITNVGLKLRNVTSIISKYDLRNEDLRFSDLHSLDLSNKDLSYADLTGANLFDTNLTNTKLIGTKMINSILMNSYLSNNELIGADLSGTNLHNAILTGVDLSGKDLTGTVFSGADLSGANLHNAILTGVDLSGADLTRAILENADLFEANLKNTTLIQSNLNSVNLRNSDLSEARIIGTTMNNADLTNAKLANTNLRGTFLENANLSYANLTGSIANGAHFKGANLNEAILIKLSLLDADMTGANLNGTKLNGTLLSCKNHSICTS